MSLARDRGLLLAFLIRLEETGALSCPAANLIQVADDLLKECPNGKRND